MRPASPAVGGSRAAAAGVRPYGDAAEETSETGEIQLPGRGGDGVSGGTLRKTVHSTDNRSVDTGGDTANSGTCRTTGHSAGNRCWTEETVVRGGTCRITIRGAPAADVGQVDSKGEDSSSECIPGGTLGSWRSLLNGVVKSWAQSTVTDVTTQCSSYFGTVM